MKEVIPLKKITKIISGALAILTTACFGFTTPASADEYDVTTLPGYSGRFAISGGLDYIYRGDTLILNVGSSEGHEEDVSKLQVTWSVANSSEVSISDQGFNKENDDFEADVTFLKGGVTVPIYAIVNGIRLESDYKVRPDANGLYTKSADPDPNLLWDHSDTLGKFTIPYHGIYTFKITTNNGFMVQPTYGTGALSYDSELKAGPADFRPLRDEPKNDIGKEIINGVGTVEVGNSILVYPNSSQSFQYISTTQSGSDYYIKFKAIGKVGSSGGFYLFDANIPFAVATITPAPFQSDTTGRLSVKKSGTYQFLITSSIQPELGIGSDSFKLLSSSHAGSHYYYRIRAVGSVGQASGIYVNHSPSPIAVATIY